LVYLPPKTTALPTIRRDNLSHDYIRPDSLK
jgi:hypothetical protein